MEKTRFRSCICVLIAGGLICAACATSSATPSYTQQERDEIIQFCNEFEFYLSADAEFWSAWNSWKPNLDDSDNTEEYLDARDFHAWAIDLDAEISGLSRYKSVRHIQDLLLEYTEALLDATLALSEHYSGGSISEYEKYSEQFHNSSQLKTQSLDEWADLAARYYLDPWTCRGLGGVLIVTALPTATIRPRATQPRPIATSRPRATSTPSCTDADSITLRHVGKTMCVTGFVRRAYETDEGFFIEFGSGPDSFYILSYDWTFPDMKPGDCVVAIDKIQKLGQHPVMVVAYKENLYYCR